KMDDTRAFITGLANVDALALGDQASVLTGEKVGGVPQTKLMRGVSLTATNFDNIHPLAGAVGLAGLVAVNGSGYATVLGNHVAAHLHNGAKGKPNDARAARRPLAHRPTRHD